MNCSDVSKLLYDYTKNEVSPDEKEAIRLHLDDCPKCSAELKELYTVKNIFKESQLTPSPAIIVRIRESMQRKHAPRFSFKPVFAAAAAILLVCGVFAYSNFDKMNKKSEITGIIMEDYTVAETAAFDSDEFDDASYIYDNDII
jgi:anti-sigma factor RsiW